MDHSNRIGLTILIFQGLALTAFIGCSKNRESAKSAFESNSDQSLAFHQKPTSQGFFLQGSDSNTATGTGSGTGTKTGTNTNTRSGTGTETRTTPPLDTSLNPDPFTPGGTSTPLVIDLDGDGLISTAYKTHRKMVLFDINGIGKRELNPWIAPKDGFLVYDHNSNGNIDSGQELFGNGTLIQSSGVQNKTLMASTAFANGFDALSTYDLDHNGKIDAQDPVFAGLQIWQDFNLNGIADKGELSTLGHWGILSISLNYTNLAAAPIILDDSGTYIGQKSITTTKQGHRGIFDVYFRFAPESQISRNTK